MYLAKKYKILAKKYKILAKKTRIWQKNTRFWQKRQEFGKKRQEFELFILFLEVRSFECLGKFLQIQVLYFVCIGFHWNMSSLFMVLLMVIMHEDF